MPTADTTPTLVEAARAALAAATPSIVRIGRAPVVAAASSWPTATCSPTPTTCGTARPR